MVGEDWGFSRIDYKKSLRRTIIYTRRTILDLDVRSSSPLVAGLVPNAHGIQTSHQNHPSDQRRRQRDEGNPPIIVRHSGGHSKDDRSGRFASRSAVVTRGCRRPKDVFVSRLTAGMADGDSRRVQRGRLDGDGNGTVEGQGFCMVWCCRVVAIRADGRGISGVQRGSVANDHFQRIGAR